MALGLPYWELYAPELDMFLVVGIKRLGGKIVLDFVLAMLLPGLMLLETLKGILTTPGGFAVLLEKTC